MRWNKISTERRWTRDEVVKIGNSNSVPAMLTLSTWYYLARAVKVIVAVGAARKACASRDLNAE